MKQTTTTAWIGQRLVRKGDLLDDTDALVKSHPDLFVDAEAKAKVNPPKVFTADSIENPPARPQPIPGPQIMTAPERRKPGPKPGTKRTGTPTPEAPSGS